jgi:hypothetical protein
VTVLYIYGNLFYAAADTFEKSLPAVEGTNRAVVILLLRGYEDIGSMVAVAAISASDTGGSVIMSAISFIVFRVGKAYHHYPATIRPTQNDSNYDVMDCHQGERLRLTPRKMNFGVNHV